MQSLPDSTLFPIIVLCRKHSLNQAILLSADEKVSKDNADGEWIAEEKTGIFLLPRTRKIVLYLQYLHGILLLSCKIIRHCPDAFDFLYNLRIAIADDPLQSCHHLVIAHGPELLGFFSYCAIRKQDPIQRLRTYIVIESVSYDEEYVLQVDIGAEDGRCDLPVL